MRRLITCATIVPLLAISMPSSHAETHEITDVFDILRQSEFLKTEAWEIPCEGLAEFPTDGYHSLCFKMNPQTLTDFEQAAEVALSIGIKLRKAVTEAGWEIGFEGVWHVYNTAKECTEEVEISFEEVFEELYRLEWDEIDGKEIDFPIQFTPHLNFHKRPNPTCVG